MDLSRLPSVDEVVRALEGRVSAFPRKLVVNEIRRVIDAFRAELRKGSSSNVDDVPERVLAALRALETPSLRKVINATGVVLHTNLGRAPLPSVSQMEGYSNLEYDIASGRRGKRDVHIGGLLERLLEHPGIAVNNNAAAVYLTLNELAAGYEVIVSRGELIEIGDGFRIPDIMRRAGVTLVEVGATNRTSIDDYRNAITERTRLLLRVHPSNFHVSGFTGKPKLEELTALGHERGIPVYEDLGSGCLVDLRAFGVQEPLVSESLRAGVNVVSFSGDKLMGGPQAGLIAGNAELITRLRCNPMFRALRLDKLIYQTLEQTLRLILLERCAEIPALRMIMQTPQSIRSRAESLAARIPGATLTEGESVIGGGSTPDQTLPTTLITIQPENVVEFERALRMCDPPVIARIEDNRLLIDLRTVFENEEDALVEALQARS